MSRKRATVNLSLHPELHRRLQREAATTTTPLGKQRTMTAIIEQALAEYLAVPIANLEIEEAPLELCPACERGLLWGRHCYECGWIRKRKDKRAPVKRIPLAHDMR